jgi:rhodanese-related sulfurtransferase
MRKFTAQQLHQRLQKTDPPFLLDVREKWEFAFCHIELSVLIPMGQIQYNLDTLDPARETVVICHHGIRSRQIAHFLELQGFEDVINLEGGVEDWSSKVDLQMPRY